MRKDLFEKLMWDIVENPLTYEESLYTLHKKNGNVAFWVGNGFFFFNVHKPVEAQFTLYQKWVFSKALKNWRDDVVLLGLEDEP